MKTIITAAVLLATAATASAEWGMYTNRDNKGWVLERTYAFEDDCKWEARALWRAGKVIGAGCAEYTATSFTRQAPRPAPAQRPTEQAQTQDGGKGRKDAAIEYRQRVLDSARESAHSNSGGHQRVYTNGDSYYGREVQDAMKALDRERAK